MTDAKDLWELGIIRGALDEQERIIRLLQDKSFINSLGDTAINEKLEVLIALIKGEQK